MATKTKKFQLNRKNYHSIEADKNYMSVSQFKDFMDCEARALAKLKGDYKEPQTNAQLVGSYVHAAFESDEAFNRFIEQHNDAIFKARGGKYADFEQADLMIETLKNDRFAMFALEGEKEQIYTGELFGVEWKIKVDSINHQRRSFTDIKTTSELNKRYWSERYETWVSFVEAWDYVLQMAIYRAILEKNFGVPYTPYIVAVTKEKPPNKAVIHFDSSRFAFEYEYIEMHIDRILQVKNGDVEPHRCEKCDYCRATKVLSGTVEVGDLIYL